MDGSRIRRRMGRPPQPKPARGASTVATQQTPQLLHGSLAGIRRRAALCAPPRQDMSGVTNVRASNTLRRWSAILLSCVAIVAGIVGAATGALTLDDGLRGTGLPDPGPATSYGLPFVRAAGEIAAVVAIGNYLFAAFLVPPQSNGVLDADGYRALRLGGIASAIWGTCAALMVVLTISELSGVPLGDLSLIDVWSAASFVETASAWRWTAVVAAVVAVASVPVLRWSWTPALLAGALLTLVPLAATGHSSAGAHDIATNSLLIHLVAAALWSGGLLALLGHLLRRGHHTYVAARRFSTIALWCFVAVAISGVINAAARIAPSDILESNYGRLLGVKVLALCALGALGWRQRRSAIASLKANPSSRVPLLRLILAETAVFAVTFGVAVRLGRTPPPAALTEPTPAEVAIGFDLAEPLTISQVLFGWRFDLVFGTAAIALALIYLVGVHRLRRQGASWPLRRTCFWVLGCLAMLFVTSTGFGRYVPAMFSMHMLTQLVMAMFVPVVLVLGMPVTLALQALRTSRGTATPGLQKWLLSALHSPWTRFLTFPATATLLFVASGYGLYVAGGFDIAVTDHLSRVLMTGYSLLSGTLFFWVVIGVEPSPHRPSMAARTATAVAGLSPYMWIGSLVKDRQEVFGESFYRSLQLHWHTELIADQKLGGEILVMGTALMFLVVVGVLFWLRKRQLTDVEAVVAPVSSTTSATPRPAI